ncbi:MAG: hypothetical protein ABIX12_16690, partial [Rubrivivax sp.]
DIEFVARHLPEVAMDNRYASLPVWSAQAGAPRGDAFASSSNRAMPSLTIGYSRTGTGELSLAGPTLAVSLQWGHVGRWSTTGFGFYDRETFSGSADLRPLRTLAIADAPLPLPAPARFDSRGGHATHTGLGLAFMRASEGARLGRHDWVVGIQAERMQLAGYAFDYRILGGPASGTTGTVAFDGQYAHLTPFAGLEFPRRHGRWTFAPHALVAVPLPRRGVLTQLSGPGFDLRGDTAQVGHGRHFGDPSLALGFDATYEPWGLSVDIGSTLTQATLERVAHTGIDSNWSLALGWRF